MAKKEFLKISLLLIIASIPWLSRYLWENVNIINVGSITVGLFINFLFAFAFGFIFWKAQLKLNLLVSIILIIIISNHIWSVNQFNYIKEFGQMGASPSEPECYKETNYRDYWDYITNGCHLTIKDVALSMTYKIIMWLIILPATLYLLTNNNRRNRKRKQSPKLLDEF